MTGRSSPASREKNDHETGARECERQCTCRPVDGRAEGEGRAMNVVSPVPFGRERTRAIAILASSTLAAVITQALLFDAGIGLGWLVVDVALVSTMIAILGGKRTTVAGAIVGAACIVLGASIVFHASDWAVYVAFPANVALLLVLPF